MDSSQCVPVSNRAAPPHACSGTAYQQGHTGHSLAPRPQFGKGGHRGPTCGGGGSANKHSMETVFEQLRGRWLRGRWLWPSRETLQRCFWLLGQHRPTAARVHVTKPALVIRPGSDGEAVQAAAGLIKSDSRPELSRARTTWN